ncbi:hypothetical protein [Butyrivibrio sp. VCB2001]|uniref:hypothetical protein n=1 Tax=Butyrivibrio sp. VCB2001 TaxID=1280667 RepID=UPI0003FA430D|nr:hypothetical protein [Butyrivibrio sp. VCB2001]
MRQDYRQIYNNDSEIGRMKLKTVKENLYEATTKVMQYAIEMYTHKELRDWMLTDLRQKSEETSGKIRIPVIEIEQGSIGLMDITNCYSALNGFVISDAFTKSKELIEAKKRENKDKIAECEVMIAALQERECELKAGDVTYENQDGDTRFFDDKKTDDDLTGIDIDQVDNESEYVEDDDDEEIVEEMSEMDLFRAHVKKINNINAITEQLDKTIQYKERLETEINNMVDFEANGKAKQKEKLERSALDGLRILRNDAYGHRTEDEIDISEIGTWEPDPVPLLLWAEHIKYYLQVMDLRYLENALFDPYYKAKEGKDNFDSCKIFVQKQVNSLYVNQSGVSLEFAGELYDRNDPDYNFKALIRGMAVNWDTGIKYLTIVTNDDMPELNEFFKVCLSGTDKYVDSYLVNRNELRNLYRKGDKRNVDSIYFDLLYSLNPELAKIYWKGEAYSESEFARKFLYVMLRCRSPLTLRSKIEQYESEFEGLDVITWCEKHLLAETYYKTRDNEEGRKLADKVETMVISFMNAKGQQMYSRFKKTIRAVALLYFYMTKKNDYWFGRRNRKPEKWSSLEDAQRYMEDSNNFRDFTDLCTFIDETSKSEYFKQWKKIMNKKRLEEVKS